MAMSSLPLELLHRILDFVVDQEYNLHTCYAALLERRLVCSTYILSTRDTLHLRSSLH